MQQRPPPRDRIIRPSAADHLGSGPVRNQSREPIYEEEYDDGFTQEELTGDALTEWLTQKAINLEIRIFHLEKKVGIKAVQPRQNTSQQPIPARRQQPYEERYTQEAPEPKPKKSMGAGRLIALFAAIILVGVLIVNIIGIVFFGYTLPF
jgi:hypothetical protein